VLYDSSLVHVFHVFHAIATEQIDSNSAYRRKKASTLSVDWHTIVFAKYTRQRSTY